MKMLFRLVVGMLCAGATTVSAFASGTVSGTVTASSDSSTVAGASVVLVGSAGQYGAITDSLGAYSIPEVDDGSYTISISAPGFSLLSTTLVTSGNAASDHSLTASGRLFRGAPAFGADIRAIVADGRSGVFYSATNVVPQIFRTFDYGGTWSPITLSVDDASGVPSNIAGLSPSNLITSGFPGEVAVLLNSKVYFSQNFGNSWQEISAPDGFYASSIYWGHKGATSVVLAVHGTTVWRADMSTTSPILEAYPTTLLTTALDRLTVGNGGSAPYVAVVNQSGTQVDLYVLTASGSFTLHESITITAPAGEPYYIAMGGESSTSGAPPNVVVVGSVVFSPSFADKLAVVMKASSSTNFSAAPQNTFDLTSSGCNSYYGAIAPNSGGAQAAIKNGLCWLELTESGGSLSGTPALVYNATRGTFDSDYDGSSNQVILSPDESRGVVKSVGVDFAGVPTFDLSTDASAGTSSGGIAVNGIAAPIVEDTAYAPSSSILFSSILKPKGGNRSMVTTDGGTTMQVAVKRGGYATDWWTGSDSKIWLVFGHGSAEGANILSAFKNWTSSTTLLTDANVVGGTTSNLAPELNPSYTAEITALKGVRGADLVFIGAQETTGVDGDGYAVRQGVVMRGSLSDSGTAQIGSLLRIGNETISAPVRALEYCPSSGSHASVADVLFVGTGYFSTVNGAFYRVENATSNTPIIATIPSVPGETGPVNDIRADCTSGSIFAGIGNGATGGSGAGGLYKSTDGGQTFSIVSSLRTEPTSIAVKSLAISALAPNLMLAAGGQEGYLYRTDDSGETWNLMNDPSSAGQSFTTEGIKDLEMPEVASGASSASKQPKLLATTSSASIGTGAGLFTATFSTSDPGTTVSAPGSVRGVKVSRAKTSASIKWKAPALDGGSEILNYTIALTKKRTITVSASKLKVKLSKLSPNKSYKATIKAVNIAGSGTGTVAKIKKYRKK